MVMPLETDVSYRRHSKIRGLHVDMTVTVTRYIFRDF